MTSPPESKKGATIMISSPTSEASAKGRLTCDSALEDSLPKNAVSCPCCGGTLTPEMLTSILEEARRVDREGTQPRIRSLDPGTMMIDPHAHMI